MDAAMALLTKAIRSFLGSNLCGVSILRLQLKFYLVNNYSDAIGPLVSEAINMGTIRDLDLAIVDEKNADDCYVEEMLEQARSVDGFFSAYPSVLNCLTKLSLYNICFADWDIHHILFDCCNHLQHLSLTNCDAGGLSVWKINAPDSKLCVLELYLCLFGSLEVISLPKLERLCWDSWICPNAPLSLGVLPSLKELCLFCAATVNHNGFMLSEVLSDTTTIQNLTLSFQGEKLWIQPEGKQLCTAFNKLRKLSLHDVYIEFDLLWMMFLLEAAPSIEIFDIEIWEHPCIVDTEARRKVFGERINPSWKEAEFKSQKEWLLKKLQVTGFSPLEQQIVFIKAVMGRAPKLQNLVLKDHQHCDYCEEIGALPRSERLPAERVFPKGKDYSSEAT
ncbi:hypothetical protein C2845_PM04G32780 [Panicum miliaceum]|uniref:At1g61320/AtMIF1 LRR domain-containing protein n=1 Tax=Panicum miliaceum TaxID=4540 RepID=A0A3L6QSA6_PANMI|nr:hypothetical protein C2845_PM04G32780 [Panicum miliaceum]